MKRILFLTLILIGALAVWPVVQVLAETRANNTAALPPVYDATGAMLEAIQPSNVEVRTAPVYDATGAMLEAINPEKKVVIFPVYDATGAMLEATNPEKKVVTFPAYDATGAMLEAIHP
ncbi:MAG: hypothetical protein ACM3ND_13160 [Acidobacteriota bacterium]